MEITRRLRRLRKTQGLREMVRETVFHVNDLIWPVFIVEGKGIREGIPSMPGVERYSIDQLAGIARNATELGIPSLLLFGVPNTKQAEGRGAWEENSLVAQAIQEIKESQPELVVISDVCLCSYTSHGHCGVLVNGKIDNDRTVDYLVKTAIQHARAGADIVAPSDMMDGRVGAIRRALDSESYTETLILSYAVKFASSFYGPFRCAAECAPAFGDRRTYQMDFGNRREALREVAADIEEGADVIMVKPAMAYLDIVRDIRNNFHHPIVAYNVSGEYSMVKSASAAGWIDEKKTVMETLIGMKRAGADAVITYFAPSVAEWLLERRVTG